MSRPPRAASLVMVGWVCAVATLLCPRLTAAQDIVGMGVEYVPQVKLIEVEGLDDVPELALIRVHLNLAYHLLNTDRAMLALGLSYRGRIPRVENQRTDIIDTFHEVALRGLFRVRVAGAWFVSGQMAPMLATNFEAVDRDHFRLTGAVVLGYTLSDRFEAGVGVAATYFFGELAPLPALRLDWQIVDTVRLNVLLPSYALLTWRVADRVELGLAARLEGNRYNISSRIAPAVGQLVYTQADAGGLVDVRLTGPIWLSFRGGYTLYRNAELRDQAGEPLSRSRDVKNAPILGVSLALRPEPQSGRMD